MNEPKPNSTSITNEAAETKPALAAPAFALDLANALSNLDTDAFKHFASLVPDDMGPLPDLPMSPLAESPTAAPTSSSRPDLAAQLDELADDMLSLLKRVKAIEDQQRQVLGCLERVQVAVTQAADTSARESDSLRRELIGQRKHVAQMSAFTAVVTGVERLQVMHSELHPKRDAKMHSQLTAVLQTLTSMLRTLGFVEFRAEVNEPFDPTRMECLGYAPGEPNIVLNCVRPGFMAGQTVVRPAGVQVAPPTSTLPRSS